MKRLISYLAGVMLALSLFTAPATFTGCKAHLDPSGVYAGDNVAYQADLAITTSQDVVSTFLKWELANRPALASKPEIKAFADSLRRDFPGYSKSAVALRDSYKLAPNADTLTKLQAGLEVLHQAVVQATAYLAQSTLVKKG